MDDDSLESCDNLSNTALTAAGFTTLRAALKCETSNEIERDRERDIYIYIYIYIYNMCVCVYILRERENPGQPARDSPPWAPPSSAKPETLV